MKGPKIAFLCAVALFLTTSCSIHRVSSHVASTGLQYTTANAERHAVSIVERLARGLSRLAPISPR